MKLQMQLRQLIIKGIFYFMASDFDCESTERSITVGFSICLARKWFWTAGRNNQISNISIFGRNFNNLVYSVSVVFIQLTMQMYATFFKAELIESTLVIIGKWTESFSTVPGTFFWWKTHAGLVLYSVFSIFQFGLLINSWICNPFQVARGSCIIGPLWTQ